MRIAATLATFVAGCALALVLAYWVWQVFGPSPIHLPLPASTNPAATIIAANLFSGPATPANPPAPSEGAVLSGDTRLLGIVAEKGQRGYALFRLPSGPKLVAQGQEIAPGARLVSVEPQSIVVRDGDGERRLLLRAAPAVGAQAPGTNARAGAIGNVSSGQVPRGGTASTMAHGVAAATCGPPAGFAGTVVRLNTELLGGIGADAAQWRTLLAPGTGGLTVREDGGFSAMLGLKAGDRIAQANGIALTVPDDVTSAVLRPLVANQGVRLTGSRGGVAHEIWLANVACAG